MYEDLVGFLAALVVDRLQLLDPRQASLALGAAALGVAARPLEFLLDRLLARLLLRVLALEAVVLLHQPVGVVALPRDRSEEHTSELQSLMRISYAVFSLKQQIT